MPWQRINPSKKPKQSRMKNSGLLLCFTSLVFSACMEQVDVSKTSMTYELKSRDAVKNINALAKDFTLRHLPKRQEKWRNGITADGYSEANGINELGLVVGGSCINSCSSYQAYSYWHNTFVTYPTFGGYASVSYGINNKGEMVGQADAEIMDDDGSFISVAFLIRHGQMTKLGTLPGYAYSQAFAINDLGEIVGRSYNSNPEDLSTPMRAVIFDREGEVTDIGTLGGSVSLAFGINDRSQIVGRATGEDHAFVYCKGKMRDLATLGGKFSTARDINNAGTIVGGSHLATPGQRHAFAYSKGVMTDLGTLGGDFSEAFSVNENGTIVGAADNSMGERHAFRYQNGSMKDLGTLGGSYSAAFCINNRGDIVGESETEDGWVHAFLYRNGKMIDLGVAQNQSF